MIEKNYMQPLISVVMSIYNEPQVYLRESIESVLKQTFSNFELIIIIDNPDYKEAREIINAYAANDKRINVILNESNLGLAASLNKGFFVAKGRYIARMDADDISFEERLKKQIDFIEGHPAVMLVGSSMVYIDEHRKTIETRLVRSNYAFLKRFIIYGGTPCFHPTWFFRRELLDKIKGYRLLPTSQDYDFLSRMFYLGIKVSNIEEPLLYHRIHFARISAEKNIDQLKLTRYIIKAAKEGFILDDGRFSQDALSGVLKTSPLVYLLHKWSLSISIFSRRLRNDNRRFFGFMLYAASLFISPYRLKHACYGIIRSIVLITKEIQSISNEGGKRC